MSDEMAAGLSVASLLAYALSPAVSLFGIWLMYRWATRFNLENFGCASRRAWKGGGDHDRIIVAAVLAAPLAALAALSALVLLIIFAG